MRERLGTLVCVVFVAFGATLLVAGCGGDDDEEQVAEALGGGEEDVDTLETFFDELQSFPDHQIELVAAFRSEDIPAARAAVDEQQALIDEGEEIAADFESAELSEVVDEYLAGLGGAVAAADEFVAYFEGGGGGDAATERQLLAYLEAAQTEAEAAERRFTQRLIDNLPDEADEQIREGVQEFTDRFREAQQTGNP